MTEDIGERQVEATVESGVEQCDHVVGSGVFDVDELRFHFIQPRRNGGSNARAVDIDGIAVEGYKRFQLLKEALNFGFEDISGVNIHDIDGGNIIARPHNGRIGIVYAFDGGSGVVDGIIP